MTLDVPLSLEPMEAEPVNELPPAGKTWQYEPKIDGFRCLIFRDGPTVNLQSRRQKPLNRYFPDIAAAAEALARSRFVLDGELVIPDQPFDALQLRLHPAASRVTMLAKEHPAQFVAFDLLADRDGRSMLEQPFARRRAVLGALFREIGPGTPFLLSKTTRTPATARTWLKRLGKGLDGIVAKRLDLPYRSGERAMQKFKVWQTVDCVVGGVYYRRGDSKAVEYLLMGLYDEAGKLNYVGRCGIGEINGHELSERLQPLMGSGGFTGNAPGGKSRWSGRERNPVPLRPRLVAEVSADHIENGRFRHGSRLLRWRTDKAPESCTMAQIEQSAASVRDVRWLGAHSPPARVLDWFYRLGQVRQMPDLCSLPDDEAEKALMSAIRGCGGRSLSREADLFLATIAAETLIERLGLPGFVVMKRPGRKPHSTP